MIVMYGDSSLLKALQNDKLLSQIPAIKNGAVVLLDQNTDLAAGVTPSILSIPYTIDDYFEALREAAEKVQ
jgi:iron complex transport system substrate-binding protein